MPFQKGHEINLGKKHSEETRNKISSSLKGRMPWNKGKKGVMPPAWNKGKKNSFANTSGLRTKEAIEKSRLARIGLTPWNKGIKMNDAMKEKISLARKGGSSWNKGIKGKKSHSFGHKNYVTNRADRIRYAAMGPIALQNKIGYINIEKVVYSYLKNKNLYFEPQKLINNRFLVDTYIPSRNLIIEVDGGYWHSLDKAVKKDKAENAYLLKCGYNLLRLKENEIMDNSYERRLLKWL